jgi:hypothetical protein
MDLDRCSSIITEGHFVSSHFQLDPTQVFETERTLGIKTNKKYKSYRKKSNL